MIQSPETSRTLYDLQYYINPVIGANLRLPLATNPLNFSAMRENGLSANAWGTRVDKQGEIYIYCRDHMREIKISLHASGTQFVAFRKESGIKMTGDSRLWHRWSEPNHQDDSSIVPTFNLLLPSWGLSLSQETRDTNRRVWDSNHIFIAGTEDPVATIVSFVIKNSDVDLSPGPSEDWPFLPIGVLDTRFGKRLWVCVQYRDEGNMKMSAREVIASANEHTKIKAELEKPSDGETFTLCAGGFDSEGVAYMLPFPVQMWEDESDKTSKLIPTFGE